MFKIDVVQIFDLVQISSGYNFAVLPLVQWGDISAELVDDMVYYIKQSAQGDESTTYKEIPRSLIVTRCKQDYHAQRQQQKQLHHRPDEDAFKTEKTA